MGVELSGRPGPRAQGTSMERPGEGGELKVRLHPGEEEPRQRQQLMKRPETRSCFCLFMSFSLERASCTGAELSVRR